MNSVSIADERIVDEVPSSYRTCPLTFIFWSGGSARGPILAPSKLSRGATRRQFVQQALDADEELSAETRARLLVLLAGYESTPDATAAARLARQLAVRHRLSELCIGVPDHDHYEAVAAGDLELARSVAEWAANLATRAGDRVAETRFMNRGGELAGRTGHLGEEWGIAEQSLALVERSHVLGMADHARFTLIAITLVQGRFDEFDWLSREVADSPFAWQVRARRSELMGDHEVVLRRLMASDGLRTGHPRVAWDLHGDAPRRRSPCSRGCCGDGRWGLGAGRAHPSE